MTDHKHTDTSRSGDLVERLYDQADRRHGSIGSLRSLEWEAADRIEALSAENERLRQELDRCRASNAVMDNTVAELTKVLQFYARENSWRSCGMYMNGRPNPSSAEIDRGAKARAALERIGDD